MFRYYSEITAYLSINELDYHAVFLLLPTPNTRLSTLNQTKPLLPTPNQLLSQFYWFKSQFPTSDTDKESGKFPLFEGVRHVLYACLSVKKRHFQVLSHLNVLLGINLVIYTL